MGFTQQPKKKNGLLQTGLQRDEVLPTERETNGRGFLLKGFRRVVDVKMTIRYCGGDKKSGAWEKGGNSNKGHPSEVGKKKFWNRGGGMCGVEDKSAVS